MVDLARISAGRSNHRRLVDAGRHRRHPRLVHLAAPSEPADADDDDDDRDERHYAAHDADNQGVVGARHVAQSWTAYLVKSAREKERFVKLSIGKELAIVQPINSNQVD